MKDWEVPTVRTSEILDRIDDAFFALDHEWRFTYLNDRAERMLDRPREQLLGRVIWDEFPETVETQFPGGFHRAMETQDPVSFEVYHTPQETWFEARAYPSESGLTVSLRDVTDRKERQRELARYGTIVETIRDGVFTIDDDRIAFVNNGFETTLSVEETDVVGERVANIHDHVSIEPEDAADLGHALDQLRRGDASYRRFEFSHGGDEGDRRVAETRMVALDEGKIAGIVRDVTENREYERVVESLHAITPELLGAEEDLEICSIAVHAAGEVLDLRISGIWLLEEGHNRLDPVAGTAGAHEELGGLPHFPRGEGVVWRAFRKGESALYDDVRDVEGHDRDTPLRSEIVVPIGDHGVLMAGETAPGALDGTDLELATILAANTEAALDRAERTQLLRESKDVLERQTERMEVVETVLSEDISDRLGIAAQRAREAGAEEAAETLVDARQLANDALELARGETSIGPRASLEAGEVATTAAGVVDGVTVDVREGAWLRADRERAIKLFETLFLDARDRMEWGGPDLATPGDPVTVRIGVADESTLFVDDDAPPLPEAERDSAFDLSEATDGGPVAEPGEGGTPGLGLAVASEIAVAHDWEIGVETGPDGSVRFEITGITTLEPTE